MRKLKISMVAGSFLVLLFGFQNFQALDAPDGSQVFIQDLEGLRMQNYLKSSLNRINFNIGGYVYSSRESFGDQISFDGNYMAVVSPTYRESLNRFGLLTIYQKSRRGWVEVFIERLEAPCPYYTGDSNGCPILQPQFSVSVSGNLVAVGAPLGSYGVRSSKVLVYKNTNGVWAKNSEAMPGGAPVLDRFGIKVKIQNGEIFAQTNPVGVSQETRAYVCKPIIQFTLDAWDCSTAISFAIAASDNMPVGEFAVSGNYLMVHESIPGEVTNKIYVHKKTNEFNGGGVEVWVTTPRAIISVPRQISSLSLRGDELAVGLPNEKRSSVPGQGAVFIYLKEEETWNLEAQIRTDNINKNYQFGNSVFMANGAVLIGEKYNASSRTDISTEAPLISDPDFYNASLGNTGAAYVYLRKEYGVWKQAMFIKPPEAPYSLGKAFGSCVYASSDLKNILVSAPLESSSDTHIHGGGNYSTDSSDYGSGAVYHYKNPVMSLPGPGG